MRGIIWWTSTCYNVILANFSCVLVVYVEPLLCSVGFLLNCACIAVFLRSVPVVEDVWQLSEPSALISAFQVTGIFVRRAFYSTSSRFRFAMLFSFFSRFLSSSCQLWSRFALCINLISLRSMCSLLLCIVRGWTAWMDFKKPAWRKCMLHDLIRSSRKPCTSLHGIKCRQTIESERISNIRPTSDTLLSANTPY